MMRARTVGLVWVLAAILAPGTVAGQALPAGEKPAGLLPRELVYSNAVTIQFRGVPRVAERLDALKRAADQVRNYNLPDLRFAMQHPTAGVVEPAVDHSAAVAVLFVPQANAPARPPAAILAVKPADRAKFDEVVARYTLTEATNGPNAQLYTRELAGYVLIATQADELATLDQAKPATLSDAEYARFAQADVGVAATRSGFDALLGGDLGPVKAQMNIALLMLARGPQKQLADGVRQLTDRVFTWLDEFELGIVTFEFSPAGLGLTLLTRLPAESVTAQSLAGFTPGDVARLYHMPEAQQVYLAVTDAQVLRGQLLSAVALHAMPPAAGESTRAVLRLTDAMYAAVSIVDEITSVVVMSTAQPGELLEQYLQQQRAMAAGQGKQKLLSALDIKPKAMQVNGLDVTRMESAVNAEAATGANPQIDQRMLERLQGGQSLVTWLAAAPAGLMYVQDDDADRSRRRFEQLQIGKWPLAGQGNAGEVRRALPATASILLVVDLPGVVRSIMRIMGQTPLDDGGKPSFSGLALTFSPSAISIDLWLGADGVAQASNIQTPGTRQGDPTLRRTPELDDVPPTEVEEELHEMP